MRFAMPAADAARVATRRAADAAVGRQGHRRHAVSQLSASHIASNSTLRGSSRTRGRLLTTQLPLQLHSRASVDHSRPDSWCRLTTHIVPVLPALTRMHALSQPYPLCFHMPVMRMDPEAMMPMTGVVFFLSFHRFLSFLFISGA